MPFTLEDVNANFSKIVDFNGKNEIPTSSADTFAKVNLNIERMAAKKSTGTAPSSAPAPSGGASSGLKADGIFEMMRVFLERGEG